jgi:hypothetical protein
MVDKHRHRWEVPLLRIFAGAAIAFGVDKPSKLLIVHGLDLGSAGVLRDQRGRYG